FSRLPSSLFGVRKQTQQSGQELLARAEALAAPRAEVLDAARECAAFGCGIGRELYDERFPRRQRGLDVRRFRASCLSAPASAAWGLLREHHTPARFHIRRAKSGRNSEISRKFNCGSGREENAEEAWRWVMPGRHLAAWQPAEASLVRLDSFTGVRYAAVLTVG